MAFSRISVGFPAASLPGRSRQTVAFVVLLAALVSGASPVAPAATAALPPGAAPCFTNAVPAGYGTFLLHKSATFAQAPGTAPTALEALARIDLQSPSAYLISNAIVSGPNAFQASLASEGNGASAWSETGTEAGLQLRLPAGAWSSQFHLVFTNDDTFVGFFPFQLASNLPPVPEVLNLAAAQSINPATPFTLSWTPWVGTAGNDRLGLQLRNAAGQVVFSAASDCSGAVALAPGAGSVEIPAGTLSAATAYTAYLTFGANLLATQDDGTLMLERGYQSRTTRFPLLTASGGGGGQPGDLLNPTVSGTNLVFTVKGTPGTTYAIESTTNLITWIQEQTVTLPPSGLAEVKLPLSATGEPKFYRATSTGGTTQPPGPATLAIAFASPDQLRLTVTGTAGGVYAIESSENYISWTNRAEATIPAADTSVTVTIPIPPGTPFLAFRATGVGGTTEPPVQPQPILGIEFATLEGTTRVSAITLSGGETNRVYTLEQSSNLQSWGDSPQTLRTDIQGKGRVTVEVAPDGSRFYRASIR